MARRLRVTGFARFLLVMVILIPLAFVGASLYNGKDPLVEAKKLLGIEEQVQPTRTENTSDNSNNRTSTPSSNQKSTVSSDVPNVQLDDMMKRIEKLERDKIELEREVKNQAVEIKELRRQLNSQN